MRQVTVLIILLTGMTLLYFFMGTRMKTIQSDLPPLTLEEIELRERLRRHVETLASQIGPRNVWRYDKLLGAAAYIRTELESYGYAVQSQCFQTLGKEVCNLAVEIEGQTKPEDIVLLGAHYDTVPDSPGANDNGSGVAALLEIARELRNFRPRRTLRLVAFVNEEMPFHDTRSMGSQVYAGSARQRGDRIVAMLSLETIGFYSDEPGSQHYPNPVYAWFYPKTGNFIGFVSNLTSWRLLRRCLTGFRRHSRFPAQGVAAPGRLTGIGWSDHASFWDEGYPALMVTDTALFRYPHYHRPSDTADQLNYDAFARVTSGLIGMVEELLDEENSYRLPQNRG